MKNSQVLSLASSFLLPMIVASCVSMNPNDRTPAGEPQALTLQEMQILSKDVTSRYFRNDKNLEFEKQFQLSDEEKALLPAAEEKVKSVLHKPVIVNTVDAGKFVHEGVDRAADRKEIRVTSWNIERGQHFEKLVSFFSVAKEGKCNREKVASDFPWKKDEKNQTILDSDKRQLALDEACALNETDVLIVNEADYGLCRSGYRSVAAELAAELKMNYVFAPSFFEAEPSKAGLIQATNEFCKEEKLSETKNLTGNALLSRYPIQNVKVVPLPVGYLTKEGAPATKENNDTYCYDWHDDEISGPTVIDRGVALGARAIFGELVGRELRFGSRNAIVADIALPTGVITVVAAHLENKAKPSCRQAQMRHLLKQISSPHPLVIGGDMNTTGNYGGHRSVKRTAWDLVIGQTVESHGFWLRVFGVSLPMGVGMGINGGKAAFSKLSLTQNPTRVDLKWLRPNPEGHLFSFLKDVGFVFEGGKEISTFGKDQGPWSSTNARDKLGFEGTHYLNRTYGSEGVSKLDWFFVKPTGDRCAVPRFPRTLGRLYEGIAKDQFPSDHVPITLLMGAPCL